MPITGERRTAVALGLVRGDQRCWIDFECSLRLGVDVRTSHGTLDPIAAEQQAARFVGMGLRALGPDKRQNRLRDL